MNEQTYYAVFCPTHGVLAPSISFGPDVAIDKFMDGLPGSWIDYVKLGYTVQKIRITKIEE